MLILQLWSTCLEEQFYFRPGKPVLFGTASAGRLVFGLRGNPAAATPGFELFVRLASRRMAGDPNPERPRARQASRDGLARQGPHLLPAGARLRGRNAAP